MTITHSLNIGTPTTISPMGNTFVVSSGGSSIFGGSSIYIDGDNVQQKIVLEENGDTKEISPRLYFHFVKGKLKKEHFAKLMAEAKNLKFAMEGAAELGQTALHEALHQELALMVLRLKAKSAGYDKYITRDDVDKFKQRVTGRGIQFEPLDKFPRPIPPDATKAIATAKALQLFDSFHVLHYTIAPEKLKTTKEKIKEKDPICFGAFDCYPEALFFIADWIDEVCDLTLKEFTTKMRLVDPYYCPTEVPAMNKREAERIIARAKERHSLLKNTNRGNYQTLMSLQDLEKTKFSWALIKDVGRALWRSMRGK